MPRSVQRTHLHTLPHKNGRHSCASVLRFPPPQLGTTTSRSPHDDGKTQSPKFPVATHNGPEIEAICFCVCFKYSISLELSAQRPPMDQVYIYTGCRLSDSDSHVCRPSTVHSLAVPKHMLSEKNFCRLSICGFIDQPRTRLHHG